MGNSAKKNQGMVQVAPGQGGVYPPYQQQPIIQPQVVQQPQYAQQSVLQQQPQYAQQPASYRPTTYPQQQLSYRPSFPSAPHMPRYAVPPPLTVPNDHNPASYYESDVLLSGLTGWSIQDIERLRHEFLSYTNTYGVIDREGFRKLYVASLLNMTWEAVEHDAEAAFRNFDTNQTGVLDFNEYITACSRMARETNVANPPYTY